MKEVMKKLTDLTPTLRIAERENFHLIPIRKQEKRPLWTKWQQRRLSVQGAKSLFSKGFNIAVVAHDLWIADIQGNITIDELRDLETLVALTPHGAHAYYRGRKPMITNLYLDPRAPVRHNFQYALLPPSRILVQFNEFKALKSYWWLDYGRTAIRTLD